MLSSSRTERVGDGRVAVRTGRLGRVIDGSSIRRRTAVLARKRHSRHSWSVRHVDGLETITEEYTVAKAVDGSSNRLHSVDGSTHVRVARTIGRCSRSHSGGGILARVCTRTGERVGVATDLGCSLGISPVNRIGLVCEVPELTCSLQVGCLALKLALSTEPNEST